MRSHQSHKLASLLCLATLAVAQEELPGPRIRTTVEVVVAPVTATDRDGRLVNDLQAHEFRLFDNGKEQDIKVDISFQPISLVLAVQASANADAALPAIQKIGSMIPTQVIGEQGEAAVLAFDHRIRVMQEFTSDSDKITEALKKIRAGSTSSRMIDAVTDAVRMLGSRARNRRRILLLISETRDRASQGRLRDALIAAQLNNVSVYSVTISRLATALKGKPQAPRPDPLPPAAHPMPPNVPATPNTVAQTTGNQGGRAEFIPLMVALVKGATSLFVDNPVEMFTKGTGGAEFSFARQRGLEDAIQKIGDELHAQYLISYSPNNKTEGGFHGIQVEVNRKDVKVRTRPGYWLGS